jgi:asparagine synthase (glutamine-hydrolysing)
MCGILAVIGDYRYKEIPQALIERGRDANGIYEDEHVQLIQTRLQITGKDEIKLPLETDNWVLLFNGQIFNYKEINEKFLYDVDFKYDSDFETIIHGFWKYGTDLFKLFEGQYAIFLYNKKTQEHYFFRDELAIRTVYKLEYEGSTIYSSNLRSLPEIKFEKLPTRGYGNVTNAELL